MGDSGPSQGVSGVMTFWNPEATLRESQWGLTEGSFSDWIEIRDYALCWIAWRHLISQHAANQHERTSRL